MGGNVFTVLDKCRTGKTYRVEGIEWKKSVVLRRRERVSKRTIRSDGEPNLKTEQTCLLTRLSGTNQTSSV